MIWILYNALFPIAFLALLPYFLLRMRRRGGYRKDFLQRVGRYRPEVRARLAEGGRVWIHAVSVGEIYVAFRLMEELRAKDPGARFVLSVTTSTAHRIAAATLKEPDVLIYFPLDFPPIMRRILGLIRPRGVVLVECELWPNLVRLAKQRGIPVILVNGRISERSLAGYRKLRPFTRAVLRMMDLLCAQSEVDRRRLAELGAPEDRLRMVGSAKYDITGGPGSGEEGKAEAALRQAGIGADRVILLGGSTWAGEEAALLEVFRDLRSKHPRLALVLVPRHAERREEVLREIAERGLSVLRRSEMREGAPAPVTPPDVLLVDTTGELRSFYAAASIIFVGKSLTRRGGQNFIEPAMCGKPVVVGPHLENFPGVAEDFAAAGAFVQVQDAAGLRAAVDALADDAGKRSELGLRARRVVADRAGAIRKTAELAAPLFREGP